MVRLCLVHLQTEQTQSVAGGVFVVYESLYDVLRLMFDLKLLPNAVYTAEDIDLLQNKTSECLFGFMLFHILLFTLLETAG